MVSLFFKSLKIHVVFPADVVPETEKETGQWNGSAIIVWELKEDQVVLCLFRPQALPFCSRSM